MEENLGRATEEGSLFQDGQTCNRCRTEKDKKQGGEKNCLQMSLTKNLLQINVLVIAGPPFHVHL